jgi:hypothetical protein
LDALDRSAAETASATRRELIATTAVPVVIANDTPFYWVTTGVLGVAFLILVEAIFENPPDIALLLVPACLAIVLAWEVSATRAQNLWLRGPSIATLSRAGIYAEVRKTRAYSRDTWGGWSLRSAVLRRPLGGFDSPNSLPWGGMVLVRFMPGSQRSVRAVAHLRIDGPAVAYGGLRAAFANAELRIPADSLASVVQYASEGGAHIHIHPKLLARFAGPPRSCPEAPGSDPWISGSCTKGMNPARLAQLLAPTGAPSLGR